MLLSWSCYLLKDEPREGAGGQGVGVSTAAALHKAWQIQGDGVAPSGPWL